MRATAVAGKAGESASDPGENRRDHREQREGGQDAAHERETEANRHGAGPGFGATAKIAAQFGSKTTERRRSR